MVDVESFKTTIRGIINQMYRLGFFGDDFDKTVDSISPIKAEKIYSWVKNVCDDKITPLMKNLSNKKYKGIPLSNLMSFRKEIQISGNDHRIMLIKIKSSDYIEFHLGDHKYYDKVRKELDLKKNS